MAMREPRSLPQLIGRQGGETHVDAVAILHVVLGNAVLENDVARGRWPRAEAGP